MPYKPLFDDDGKTLSGLFDMSAPLNDYDDIDKQVTWESLNDKHEDVFTGEATMNRELAWKEANMQMKLPSWML